MHLSKQNTKMHNFLHEREMETTKYTWAYFGGLLLKKPAQFCIWPFNETHRYFIQAKVLWTRCCFSAITQPVRQHNVFNDNPCLLQTVWRYKLLIRGNAGAAPPASSAVSGDAAATEFTVL